MLLGTQLILEVGLDKLRMRHREFISALHLWGRVSPLSLSLRLAEANMHGHDAWL